MQRVDPAIPEKVRDLLTDLMNRGEIELPMLPAVAQEVLALCQSEDVDAEQLSAVLHRDPSLASHVLRVANSPLYSGNVPIVSLQQAISRMGLQALSEIAIAVAVRGKVFEHAEAQGSMVAMWEHSVATALFAKEIARSRRRNVESAFLCGLLHDIGKPVILTTLYDCRDALPVELSEDVIHAVLDAHHSWVGEKLAELWQLPPSVAESIRYHHDEYDEAPSAAEAAMLTCLADYLAHLVLPNEQRPTSEDDVRDLPVLESLNIYPDELEALFDLREKVLDGVREM